MSLEDFVKKAGRGFDKVREYISGPEKLDNMVQYGVDHYLTDENRRLLFDNKSETQRQQLMGSLKLKMQEKRLEYQDSLDKLSLKVAGKGGLAVLASDVYHTLRGTPFEIFWPFKYGIASIKGLLELPAMYQYVKKSWDLYSAVEWLGYKAVSMFIPVIGPALDYNSAQRIIRKGIVSEGVKEWLKEQKLYEEKEPLLERVKKHVKDVVNSPEPALQPA
ncbi:MAG: hypothetical protein V1837_05760 [Candidatus Woesearchaeota archaeon]